MRRSAVLAVLTIAALPSGPGAPRAQGAPATSRQVNISDFAFEPDQLVVKVGETVQWSNITPGTRHTVTAENGAFDSNAVRNEGLDGGLSFSHVFDQTGTYPYYCTIHTPANPTMKGTIVVEAADAPAQTTGKQGDRPQTTPKGNALGVPLPIVAAVFVVLIAVAFFVGYRGGPKEKRRGKGK
jgi:plastocyanin